MRKIRIFPGRFGGRATFGVSPSSSRHVRTTLEDFGTQLNHDCDLGRQKGAPSCVCFWEGLANPFVSKTQVQVGVLHPIAVSILV